MLGWDSYAVEGRKFTLIWEEAVSDSSRAQVDRLLAARYPVGLKIVVRYDPADPHISKVSL